jgi:hypothetical protein
MKFILAAVFILGIGEPVYCATIANTFGPGGTFNDGTGWGVVSPYEIAYPFTVPGGLNYVFDSASLALSQGIGSDNSVTVDLATNSAGVPGLVLESFIATVEAYPDDTTPVSVTSVLNPVLDAGDVYWLILYPTAGNGVNWLTAGVLTTPDLQATRSSSSAAWTASPLLYGANGPGAFSVDATAVALPELSTWWTSLGGIAFSLLLRRRR